MPKNNEIDLATVTRINGQLGDTVARVAKIISGLRTFARDGRKDSPVAVSVSSLMTDTLGLCGEHQKGCGVALHQKDDYADVSVSCRPTQVVQVLLNLVNNARDAVQGTPAPSIELSLTVDDEYAEIRVIDSGPGIPAKLRDRIMEPFFTTKPVGQGTGIGLSIARSLAEENGGTLTLDEDHPSTCFVLRLPRLTSTPMGASP